MKFIARDEELNILEREYQKNDSSFIAVYGRRRIGKTALINHFLNKKNGLLFSVTGAYDVKTKEHLANFSNKLSLAFGSKEKQFNNWSSAFQSLQIEISSIEISKNSKMTIFIDELPWLAEMRDNGFKGALSLFWNDFASKREDIFLVVCGSATSWIINHVINDHGSLSNRITALIHLETFNLRETKEFLETQGHKGLSHKTVMDYYMVLGGVAHYLKLLNPKLSFVQNIQELFFKRNGVLRTEYNRLFRSLFKNHKTHELIVNYLVSAWEGKSLSDLSKKKGLKKGATLINALRELEESNILKKRYKYKQRKRDIIYGISDPFIYFFNRWVKDTSQMDLLGNQNFFQNIYKSQSYKSWCGFAFENICHTHIVEIKRALGIEGVITRNYYWRASDKKSGAQIDILLERDDDVINIIECKYHNQPFSIDKRYALQLENKELLFQKSSSYMGSIQLVMITSAGLKENSYSQSLISHDFSFEILFKNFKKTLFSKKGMN
ncbi:archaeal ATPase, fused to C-terminal DUF234 domain [hydrothermal vent metagenome]|uniref:Archaeal ATPase, fused to C-terminal DUF234 domain n=1 Tax=hydrothermal vent metagenome TaxID=652676 RepID=A0A1W1C3J1_9ZZZZ